MTAMMDFKVSVLKLSLANNEVELPVQDGPVAPVSLGYQEVSAVKKTSSPLLEELVLQPLSLSDPPLLQT